MRVVIIGGGPGGLTNLKTLLHAPSHLGIKFDPILLEMGNRIGGTFDQRSYENGTLVSSKQLTCFSDFRIAGTEDHPTMNDYVKYLDAYIEKFDLDSKAGEEWAETELEHKNRIQLNSKVVKIERREKGGHIVTYETVTGIHSIHCDAVAVCSGLHVLPAVPIIEGLESLLVAQDPPILTAPGLPTAPPSTNWIEKAGVRIIHSSQYKKREEFKDRKVLILGIGETAMDLSYEAIMGGAREVTLCHRGGFLSFPKVLNDFKVFGFTFSGNLPIDGLITNLFETTYVHPWIANSRLRWHVSDWVIKTITMPFLTGSRSGCDQMVGGLPESRLGRAYVFLNKSTRAMHFINKPYRKKWTFLANVLGTEYLSPPPDEATLDKTIDLALWPSKVDETGRVHFLTSKEIPQGEGVRRIEEERMRDKEVRPDMVVYCTGYRQDFSFLGENYPQGPSKVDSRQILDSKDPSLAFIGFTRPTVGNIPTISELQSMWWVFALGGKMDFNLSEPHYGLLTKKSARIQYGVDFSAYMATLAKDIGAMPGFWELYQSHGIHVLTTYCFGAAFVSFYRLTGPFASAEMTPIVKGELWETICRRGLLGNIFMAVIPGMFYGLLNLLALIAEMLLILFSPILTLLGVFKGRKVMLE